MNKSYRTVWNHARQCLMVVGENVTPQGKARSARTSVAQAVTAALLALGAGQASADPTDPCDAALTGPTQIIGSVTGPCTLGSGGGVTVSGGSSITSASEAITASGVTAESIINNGSIANNTGIELKTTSLTGGISNSGTITSYGGDAVSLNQSTVNGGISNSGTITLSGYGSAIELFKSTVNGGIINSGSIAVRDTAIKLSYSTVTGGISNSGTITASRSTAIRVQNSLVTAGIVNSGAIAVDSNGIDVKNSTLTGGILNSGIINAFDLDGFFFNSHGISVDQSTLTGGIVNSGIINAEDHGIRLFAVRWESGGVTNSGTITSGNSNGLYMSSVTLTGDISNSGVIVAESYGIQLNATTTTGGITNSGSIATLEDEGIRVGNSKVARIVNSGVITSRDGGGINLGDGSSVTGGILNSNSITAADYGILVAGAQGYSRTGVLERHNAFSMVTGGITNSGAIFATGSASGVGVWIDKGGVVDRIVNNSTISARTVGVRVSGLAAPSTYGSPPNQFTDLAISSTVTGGITNSGLIVGGEHSITVDNMSTVTGGVLNNSGGHLLGGLDLGNGTSLVNDGLVTLEKGVTLAGGIENTGTATNGTIGGNYTQGSGGTLRIAAAGSVSGQYSQLSVSGTAGIAGTLSVDVKAVNTLADDNTLSGVITAASRSGTFAGVIDNSTRYAFSAIYSGTAVDLGVTAVSGCGSSVSTAVTGPCEIGFDGPSISVLSGGTISGASTGIHALSGSYSGSITNAGTVSGSAFGVLVGTTSADTILNGAITNASLISGNNTGIRLATASIANGGITNTGTISGGNNGEVYGIRLVDGSISGGINNQSLISSGGVGISVEKLSVISGGITNSGPSATISGDAIGINVVASLISDGITNSGLISGGYAGIRMAYSVTFPGFLTASSTISGGITNSGTISGSACSICAYGVVDGIVIDGDNTAKFIGKVYAPNTAVTVGSGATYTMDDGQLFTLSDGTTSGTFTNAGTLRIGTSTASGNIGTITGDFNNTGTFSTTVSDDGYGQLLVDGNATLSGSLFVDAELLTNGNTYAGTVGGIITASSITGTFSDVTDNSALFSFLDVYRTNGVDLTVQLDRTVEDAVRAEGNKPAYGAAGVFDRLMEDYFANGTTGNEELDDILERLGRFATDQEVSDAVSQALPLMTASQTQALLNALHGLGYLIQSRQEGQHGRSSGDAVSADGRFWFKPFGSWANQDERDSWSGFDADSYGVVFGADTALNETSRIGGAVGYIRTDVDSDSNVAPNSADIDSYLLAVYGSHALNENTELSFQADYGFHNTEGRRSLGLLLPGQQAKSDYDSWSVHLGAGLAHTYQLSNSTSLTPSVRADYTRLEGDSYHEKGGGGASLHVSDTTTEELILSVDGKLAHALTEKATFTANLGIGYDVIDDESAITSAFAGAPGVAFATKGLDREPWLVRGGLGIVGNVTESLEITARYDAEVREDFDNQSASVKLRWAF